MYATKGGSLAGCRKRGSLRLHAKFPSLRLELGNAKRVFHNLPRLAPHCRALSRQGPEDLWPSLATPARPAPCSTLLWLFRQHGPCVEERKKTEIKSLTAPSLAALVSSSLRWRGQQGIFGSLPLCFSVSFLPPPASRVRFPPTSQRLFASIFGVFFFALPLPREEDAIMRGPPTTHPSKSVGDDRGGEHEKSRASAPLFR